MQAQSKARLERAAATLMPREIVLARTSQAGARAERSSAHLGAGVVATLRLVAFDRVSELAGPVATLALFRRVGLAVDKVCLKHGALRVGRGTSTMQLGWFSSQVEGHERKDERDLELQLCRTAAAACAELVHHVLETLREMDVGSGVCVGLCRGAMSASLVGRGPSTLTYHDDSPAGGPMSASEALSEGMLERGMPPVCTGEGRVCMSRLLRESSCRRRCFKGRVVGLRDGEESGWGGRRQHVA